jgi:hypothetical protein
MLKSPTIGSPAGLFPQGETHVVADKWYLCAQCPSCQATVAVFESVEGAAVTGSGKPPDIRWPAKCAACGTDFQTPLASLVNVQAVQLH